MTNREILETGNAAIVAGDNDGFLVHCTEDTEWNFVGDRVLRGKEEVRRWMSETYLDPPKFNVDHMISENDFVIAIGTITMKDTEGKSADYSYCDVWKFRDGKMAELKAFVIPISQK